MTDLKDYPKKYAIETITRASRYFEAYMKI